MLPPIPEEAAYPAASIDVLNNSSTEVQGKWLYLRWERLAGGSGSSCCSEKGKGSAAAAEVKVSYTESYRDLQESYFSIL